MMDVQKQIQDLLDKIENEHDINIILAIESGSRAWGFPSVDSDYDVRFIYSHDRDWYLSAFQKRDVIDTVFVGDLDAGGWDVSKCMQLLNKGNAPLYEWLNSPIVYRKDEARFQLLHELSVKAFNPKVIFHHYLSLAKKKLLEEKTATHAKSFLYALRAILCARWVADDGTIPPVDFAVLRKRYVDGCDIDDWLRKLIEDKQSLNEAEKYKISDQLISFATSEFSALESRDVVVSMFSDLERYDEVFRAIVCT